MDLYPRDLGTERYLGTLRRRLMPVAGTQNGVSPLDLEETEPVASRGRFRRRGRRLRRYWVRDLQLDAQTAEALGSALWRGSPGIGVRVGGLILSIYLLIPAIITAFAAPFPVAFLIFSLWALLMWLVLASPRQMIKKLHQKKMTATEVEALLPTARGRLERAYLQLTLDTLRTEIPSTSAQEDIRAALRDLGEVVSRLPSNALPVTEPEVLRREAQEARLKAGIENDGFVRASLLRQADAFEKRAALSEQNVVSARRFSALRREARIQMDALRQVLVAFQQTAQTDANSITTLSETVSRVAKEAQAAAVAQRELEDDEIARLLGGPLPPNLPRQPVAVPTAAPAQQPQVVQSRQWWRNP